jgi:hypothetical protein
MYCTAQVICAGFAEWIAPPSGGAKAGLHPCRFALRSLLARQILRRGLKRNPVTPEPQYLLVFCKRNFAETLQQSAESGLSFLATGCNREEPLSACDNLKKLLEPRGSSTLCVKRWACRNAGSWWLS